jgi:hypothetical protein
VQVEAWKQKSGGSDAFIGSGTIRLAKFVTDPKSFVAFGKRGTPTSGSVELVADDGEHLGKVAVEVTVGLTGGPSRAASDDNGNTGRAVSSDTKLSAGLAKIQKTLQRAVQKGADLGAQFKQVRRCALSHAPPFSYALSHTHSLSYTLSYTLSHTLSLTHTLSTQFDKNGDGNISTYEFMEVLDEIGEWVRGTV